MVTRKRLHVEKYSSHFIIEYGDVGLEAQHLGQGMYAVDAYEIDMGSGNTCTRSLTLTKDPLEVILASQESRRLDLWWPLNDHYCLLNSTECDRLDVVVEDILSGDYDQKSLPKQKPKPQQYINDGINPNQAALDEERKAFTNLWARILRTNT